MLNFTLVALSSHLHYVLVLLLISFNMKSSRKPLPSAHSGLGMVVQLVSEPGPGRAADLEQPQQLPLRSNPLEPPTALGKQKRTENEHNPKGWRTCLYLTKVR